MRKLGWNSWRSLRTSCCWIRRGPGSAGAWASGWGGYAPRGRASSSSAPARAGGDGQARGRAAGATTPAAAGHRLLRPGYAGARPGGTDGGRIPDRAVDVGGSVSADLSSGDGGAAGDIAGSAALERPRRASEFENRMLA